MIDDDTPAGRFGRAPRPLDFVRIRLYRGGQAEYIRDILTDEKTALFEDLSKYRGEGRAEDDKELTDCISNIRHLNNALRDLDNGLVELTGVDGY